MTEVERRQRVEDICDAALARVEADRAAFLDIVCEGDDWLRNEVKALLSHARSGDKFLDASLGEIAADILDLSASRPGGDARASLATIAEEVHSCVH